MRKFNNYSVANGSVNHCEVIPLHLGKTGMVFCKICENQQNQCRKRSILTKFTKHKLNKLLPFLDNLHSHNNF